MVRSALSAKEYEENFSKFSFEDRRGGFYFLRFDL